MSYNNPNYKGKKKYKNDQPDVLQLVVVGIFKILWFLITLPFKGLKKGKKSGMMLEDKAYVISTRGEIEKILRSENQFELRHAVMEADKLVDFILQAKGYPGQTLGDRLKAASEYISPSLYNEIWQGHKVRNQIAHESEFQVQNQELREAAEKLLKYTKQI